MLWSLSGKGVVPATNYKIWQWGAPVGQGAMRSCHVGVAGIAKCNTDGHPHAVSNELLCNLLARGVMLPVPPGFIIDKDGEPYFASLDFNLAGQQLPPADPERVAKERPSLAAGILLFDVWVLNGDRHTGNIEFDAPTRRVRIFDHSHAIMPSTKTFDHLEANRDRLAIGGHCLAPHVESMEGILSWSDRLNALPDFYVREAVESACQFGYGEAITDACCEFLLDRRKRLLRFLAESADRFPGIESQLRSSKEKGGE